MRRETLNINTQTHMKVQSYAGEGAPPPSAPEPMDDYEPVEERFNSMMEP